MLACRKCQKKLKGEHDLRGLAKLRKTVKRYNKGDAGKQIHLVNVPCMDLCPKNGVTVCMPAQNSSRLYILRREDDMEELCSGLSERDRAARVGTEAGLPMGEV